MRFILGTFVFVLLLAAAGKPANAQNFNLDVSFDVSTTVQYLSSSKENYCDWGSNQIIIVGYGYVPTNMLQATPAARKNAARRMAQLNAQKLIIEASKGVAVVSDSVISDTELHEYFRSHSEGFIDGIMYEELGDNGALDPGQLEVKVKAIARLYGKGSSYAAAVLPYVASKQEPLAATSIYTSASFSANIQYTDSGAVKPFVPTGTPIEPPPAVTTGGPYTGLIVNAAGLGVKPAMSPNVLDPSGKNVYGYMKIDAETVIDYGIVAYARSLDQARQNARAGTNPLVVKGVNKSGSFEADVVISAAEAQAVINATNQYDFLSKLKVVFVY
jgi:hypothetical protein